MRTKAEIEAKIRWMKDLARNMREAGMWGTYDDLWDEIRALQQQLGLVDAPDTGVCTKTNTVMGRNRKASSLAQDAKPKT